MLRDYMMTEKLFRKISRADHTGFLERKSKAISAFIFLWKHISQQSDENLQSAR